MMHRPATRKSRRTGLAICVLAVASWCVAAGGAPAVPIGGVRHLYSIGSGPTGGLLLPSDVAIGPDGKVYVVDGGHDRVVIFDRDGRYVSAFGQRGGEPGQFNGPVGIGVGPDGQVYVADRGNHRVQVFRADGGLVRAFPISTGGKPVAPVDVAVGAAGRTLYVTGNTNHRLMAYTPEGRLQREWGSEGVNRGEFRYPATVAVGADQRVYVVDVFNTRVQAFDRNGGVYIVGEWGVLPGQLFRPKGVALDREGRVYVSDSYLDVVQVFDSAYRFLYVLGNGGKPQKVVAPGGIAIDAGNRLYVTEMLKNRVSVFELNP